MADATTRTSLTTTGGPSRAPNRAMLRGVGFRDEVAPWTIVEANDKHFARIKIMRALIAQIEGAL